MVTFSFNLMTIVCVIAVVVFLLTKNDIIVNYYNFPNLVVCLANFPNLEVPRAPSQNCQIKIPEHCL